MFSIDACITRLYHCAAIGTQDYRRRALTELAQVIDFDGALWGTGRLDSEEFHSVDILGVDEKYPADLARSKSINPFYNALKAAPGKVIELSEVTDDKAFYRSDIYKTFFSKYGVERVMGSVLPDESTGIVSLVSLYRFDRNRPFSQDDKQALQRIMHHLVSAASHAYFLHLNQQKQFGNKSAMAICDKHGLFFEVQPRFMEIINQYYPTASRGRLPFDIIEGQTSLLSDRLRINNNILGDLICVSIWETSPLDLLSARELEVVQAITRGLSFKQAARKIGVAPSTVSNHLYRVYRKLNISSRSELALIVSAE
ncbi:LuxR C-terminal-related transcriptional regulator [Microbulbifer sp. OS29]|uniref:LuxR C-terminal-related transcriptional regulator n=1 Tax=Microbulbifer okhotskensis TaxID=2926617 RepID=A0A9X2EU34_9GAMM|nr:LuxR C-terminal-related transcriptional regulator [Microbulbifer okhotskensis]MCO1335873.1 LuxR C-terminal-related transcriptional regulator [Microbulbifer okhotskensis]